MYSHTCKKAGAVGCGWSATASSEEELRAKLTQHVKKAHNVQEMTDTIYKYLRKTASA